MNAELTFALDQRLLALADDELILAHRDSEWTGHAPMIEEDIALANIAQDELGHATLWYDILCDLRKQPDEQADQLVYFRDAADWRDRIGALCVGNSRLVFAVASAFAGPLLRPAGMESGGFHLRGDSSSGKTTALRLAASVNGGPSYMQRWRTTSNGLEGAAALLPFEGVLKSPMEGRANLTPAQAANLLSGKWYASIRTSTYPRGGLRGQLVLRE